MADVVQAWMDHLKITGSVEETNCSTVGNSSVEEMWMDLLYLLDDKRFLSFFKSLYDLMSDHIISRHLYKMSGRVEL